MWRFNPDRFAVLIELWRDMHSVTMAEMSELTGIGQSTLYALQKGEYAPTMAQLVNVCNITQIPPDTFFRKEKGTKNER